MLSMFSASHLEYSKTTSCAYLHPSPPSPSFPPARKTPAQAVGRRAPALNPPAPEASATNRRQRSRPQPASTYARCYLTADHLTYLPPIRLTSKSASFALHFCLLCLAAAFQFALALALRFASLLVTPFFWPESCWCFTFDVALLFLRAESLYNN